VNQARQRAAAAREWSLSSDDRAGTWWYSLKHHQAEVWEQDPSNGDRLGPFPTREAAERALETVAERERKYDAEDAAWDGDAD
jgi:hypothetical protein